jgi:hypothetical protein
MKEMTYEVTTYAADKEAVKVGCTEGAGCVYLALDDYARLKQYDDDPTRSCASPFFDVRLLSLIDHTTHTTHTTHMAHT